MCYLNETLDNHEKGRIQKHPPSCTPSSNVAILAKAIASDLLSFLDKPGYKEGLGKQGCQM
jgi:hypothetical protein